MFQACQFIILMINIYKYEQIKVCYNDINIFKICVEINVTRFHMATFFLYMYESQ